MNKNLVLGTCFNYTKKDVFYFVESFLKHCQSADLMLIVDNKITNELANYFFSKKIKLYQCTLMYYVCFPIVHARFLIYNDVFCNQQLNYEQVFLTDVRDVIFLNDIFKFKTNNRINFFLESINHSHTSKHNGRFNFQWLEFCYGPEIAMNFLSKKVCCVGTTLGKQKYIREYLQIMIEQLNTVNGLRLCNNLLDTAVHNYIAYKKYTSFLHTNGVGVATLQETDPNDIIIKSGEIYVHGNAPYVLHQYDRHPELYNFVKKLYPYE